MIHFHEVNCNSVIHEHPVLIVDSNILQYDIIFGANFLDKCGFHLDCDQNLIHWMECYIPLYDTSKLFQTNITHLSSHLLN